MTSFALISATKVSPSEALSDCANILAADIVILEDNAFAPVSSLNPIEIASL